MKRIFLILLIFAVAAPALACSKQSGAENTDVSSGNISTDAAADNSNAPDEAAEESPFKPIEADYEGHNFKVAGFDSYAGMWIAVSYSEAYAEEETGDPINDAIYRRNRTVEELYNIEISLFPLSYSDREGWAAILLRTIAAGDYAFDAGLVVGSSMPRMLTTPNALIELKSIPTLDLNNPWWDRSSVRELSIANRLYAVTGDISLYGAFGTIVVYINKYLVQEHGLEEPYQLVRDGNWTWNKLYDMCKAVAADLNGDGIINKNDRVGIMAESGSLLNSLRAGGLRLTTKDGGDLPVLAGNSERMSGAIDTVLGVLRDKDVNLSISDITGYGNPYFEFALPKFRDNEALFYYNQMTVGLNLREMEADFGILPAPKLDAGQKDYGSIASEAFLTYMCIPSTNPDPERAGAILEAMGYNSQRFITPAFYDVTVTHKLTRDEGSVEMLNIILSNRVYDLATIYGWGNIADIFGDIYNKNNNNVAAGFEKREPAINAAIEKTIEEALK